MITTALQRLFCAIGIHIRVTGASVKLYHSDKWPRTCGFCGRFMN